MACARFIGPVRIVLGVHESGLMWHNPSVLDAGDQVDFVVQTAPCVVEAWSSRRLPYEPRGRSLSFRSALQKAISRLPVAPLHVYYLSLDVSPCVLTNILLHNLQCHALTGLLAEGVCIERGFAELGAVHGRPSKHYVRHEVEGTQRLRLWRAGAVVASWSAQAPPTGRYLPEDWWWAIANGLTAQPRSAPDWFMLRFVLPSQVSLRWALRPLVEGTLSALHSSPETPHEVVQRLSSQLVKDQDAVRSMLVGSRRPLPARTVVRLYRRGVRWHPDHSQLAAVSVTFDPTLPTGRFTGEMIALRKVRLPCG